MHQLTGACGGGTEGVWKCEGVVMCDVRLRYGDVSDTVINAII